MHFLGFVSSLLKEPLGHDVTHVPLLGFVIMFKYFPVAQDVQLVITVWQVVHPESQGIQALLETMVVFGQELKQLLLA